MGGAEGQVPGGQGDPRRHRAPRGRAQPPEVGEGALARGLRAGGQQAVDRLGRGPAGRQGEQGGRERASAPPRVSDEGWLRPSPGERVLQTVVSGPFVVQHREDLGLGACRLTRHRGAAATSFVVLGYSQRSEVGLPCHVVHLRDEADGAEYVVDTGLCGPGLPADAFRVAGASA